MMEKPKKELLSSADNLEKRLKECQKQKEEYLAGWQRERADFLNYKKEEIQRISELIKYVDVGLILKILPILDNLELAKKKLPEDLKSNENIRGVLQIKNQFKDFLKNQGVEEIESLGKKFDPQLHEIIGEVASSEASAKEGKGREPGTVIEEIQKGYKLHGKILRPAKVKVTK